MLNEWETLIKHCTIWDCNHVCICTILISTYSTRVQWIWDFYQALPNMKLQSCLYLYHINLYSFNPCSMYESFFIKLCLICEYNPSNAQWMRDFYQALPNVRLHYFCMCTISISAHLTRAQWMRDFNQAVPNVTLQSCVYLYHINLWSFNQCSMNDTFQCSCAQCETIIMCVLVPYQFVLIQPVLNETLQSSHARCEIVIICALVLYQHVHFNP